MVKNTQALAQNPSRAQMSAFRTRSSGHVQITASVYAINVSRAKHEPADACPPAPRAEPYPKVGWARAVPRLGATVKKRELPLRCVIMYYITCIVCGGEFFLLKTTFPCKAYGRKAWVSRHVRPARDECVQKYENDDFGGKRRRATINCCFATGFRVTAIRIRHLKFANREVA